MTPLENHIQAQQNIASNLQDILEALVTLNSEGLAARAQTVLIGVARQMAEELNANLDSVALPTEGEA